MYALLLNISFNIRHAMRSNDKAQNPKAVRSSEKDEVLQLRELERTPVPVASMVRKVRIRGLKRWDKARCAKGS